MTMAMSSAALAARSPRAIDNPLRHEPLFAAGALLLLFSMIPTAAAMALDTRLFNGINVWEKVLKFEFALALYLGTLAWFARFLPAGMTQNRGYQAYAVFVMACIVAEMLWIGGAAANGVGSHFNVDHPVMGAIYGLMGVLAVSLTSAAFVYGVAIHRNAAAGLDAGLRLSLSLGLVSTFFLTLIVAGYMSANMGHWVGGNASDAEGFVPMGWARDGGDLRVAHFFATHAMHFVPLAGLAVARLAPTGRRVGLVWAAAGVYALFTLYTFVEALAGRPFLAFVG